MNRAERRKHKFRMRQKLLKRVKNDDTLYPYLTKEELKKYIAKWADIQHMCSCQICRNPRRCDWNTKKEKLTIQERKMLIYVT